MLLYVVLYVGVRVEVSDSVTCPTDGSAQCLSLVEGNASVRQQTHTHSLTHSLTHSHSLTPLLSVSVCTGRSESVHIAL